MIKAVGFDFDGTLIMSEEEKRKQMALVFGEMFGIRRGVKNAYSGLAGKGLSRREKVEALFLTFLKRKPTQKELMVIDEHFGQHYKRSMGTCPLFRCANLIKELKRQVRFLFLLSLENRKEVKDIACKCGIGKYFDDILGGPRPKVENLKQLLQKYKLKPAEILYVGDAHSDVVASKKVKVKTVLLGKKHTYERLKEDLEADFVFSRLCDMPKELRTLG